MPGLIFGIGNQSRGDDGLGWALLDALAPEFGSVCALEYRYQLMVEDAELARAFARVLFLDASREPVPGGAALQPCIAVEESFFSTHRLAPGGVLYLCQTLYDCRPEAHILALQGYTWALGDGLSEPARGNLEAGIRLARAWINTA
jgi:hydrogenase maturation protease